MKKSTHVLTFVLLSISIYAASFQKAGSKAQDSFSSQLDNIHYFVINDKYLTKTLTHHLTRFNSTNIKFYPCSASSLDSAIREICLSSFTAALFINGIKIDYNGREGHEADVKKWIQYRVDQFPSRLHSIGELREYAQKNIEIFCYVDRKGEATSKKEYIFVAVAKRMHFLRTFENIADFCFVDVTVVEHMGLREGHLALIRKDLSFNVDFKTELAHEDEKNVLYTAWVNYCILMYVHDFRVEDRTKEHDTVIVQCDLSLQCEDEMENLFKIERTWRARHLDLNFAIRLTPQIKGEEERSDGTLYDLPALRFKKTVSTVQYVKDSTGSTIKQTHYLHTEYLCLLDTRIDADSVDRLLKMYENRELEEDRIYTSTDIQPVQATQNEDL